MILIQLKLNFKKKKKSLFQMQLNQLHIQLHPILPNTFITQEESARERALCQLTECF